MTVLSFFFLMVPVLAIRAAARFMLRLVFSFLLCASIFFCMFRHCDPPLISAIPLQWLLFLRFRRL